MSASQESLEVHQQTSPNDQAYASLNRLLVSFAEKIRAASTFLLCSGLLIFGWFAPLPDYITPEHGVGYLLGIIGGSMMLILLIYPARKRLRRLGVIGSAITWFRIHMLLGLFGPILILYHARFSTGSLNSSVALYSMILVAASGVVGRYFYTKIHYGLYGAKARMEDLKSNSEYARDRFSVAVHGEQELCNQLSDLESAIGSQPQSLTAAAWHYPVKLIQIMTVWRRLKNRLRRALKDKKISKTQYAEAMLYSRVHRVAYRKAVGLQIFERLFALWHVAHIPLFIMLVFTAIIHVVAVHMF